ncbi:MAG: hypothetical protein HQK76_08895 [Desulfobacterales bacterium]|nr:hypothetical protein [Desulfobacterales bacterium]
MEIKCYQCKKPIVGNYIRIGDRSFHPDCFTCKYCKKPINGPYQNDGSKYYHSDCYKKVKGYVCDHCGELLGEVWQVYNNKKYHQGCYEKYYQPRCDICGLPIQDKYTTDDKGKYHASCYREHKLPKCDICLRPIEGEYIKDVWGHKAHKHHNGQKTVTCDTCSRILSSATSNGAFKYSDGRYICGYCKAGAIENIESAKRYVPEILKQLSQYGMKGIPNNIPIFLVDRNQLAKISNNKFSKDTKGFTKIETKLLNNVKVSSSYEIYILFGLQELAFKGTLAHELLHVWQFEHNARLSKIESEGFCNLGSAIIYESGSSQLATILLDNLKNDPDPIYGAGYRKMSKKLESIGWAKLLDQVRGTR